MLIDNLLNQLQADPAEKENQICILSYGSQHLKEDFNYNSSDYDIHVLIKHLNSKSLNFYRDIFKHYTKVDVSLLAVEDVILADKCIFQNGTQGVYFLYVLAQAKVLAGKNFYIDILDRVDSDQVKESLQFKIKEYLWKLRRLYIAESKILDLKKYLIRLQKDILMYKYIERIQDINRYPARSIVNEFIDEYYSDLSVSEIKLLKTLPVLEEIREPKVEEIINILWRIAKSVY